MLELLGVTHHVSTVVSSDDVSSHKPDPAPYLLACAQLALEPHECVALEDSARGIESANRAGVVSVAYTGVTEDPEAVGVARLVLDSFSGITPVHLRQLYMSAVE